MSRTSSMYVSPNLGPTVPWSQQTSTGVFRPPPAMSLNPSSTNMPRHEGTGVLHERHNEVANHTNPSPPLRPTSPPFFTQNYYGKVPASVVPTNPHGITVSANGDSSGGAISYPAGRIMKMISYSVHREEDAFLAKKESNRVLEKELMHEQRLRRETQRQLEVLDETLQMLQGIREAQSRLGERLGLTL